MWKWKKKMKEIGEKTQESREADRAKGFIEEDELQPRLIAGANHWGKTAPGGFQNSLYLGEERIFLIT